MELPLNCVACAGVWESGAGVGVGISVARLQWAQDADGAVF